MKNRYRNLWKASWGSRIFLSLSALMSLGFAGHFLMDLGAQDVRAVSPLFVAHEALANRVRGASEFSPAATVSDVVSKALAFKALLNSTQQSTLEMTYSPSLARKWSNLPCAATCRNGIGLGTLTTEQLAAAQDVIRAVMGTLASEGFEEFQQIRMADDLLAAQGSGGGGPGGGGYGAGLYYLAFLNTPSTTGAWMIQFGGHHYAANIGFNQGHVVSTTPHFYGIEPLTFTANGASYAPMMQERDAMAAMLASLNANQLAAAKLTQTFSDATLIPGETNGGSGTFPTTKVGIPASSLSAAQKQLVVNAMKPWVQDMDASVATTLLGIYQNELDETYIAFTGNGVAGDASSFLNANTNYARIDGPSVWIEFVCQNGVVFRNQIHYHSVWRDHVRDYGKDLTLTVPLDASVGSPGTLTSTSAASYAVGSLAPESIGALFGSGLALTTATAATTPLPMTLGSAQVQIVDSTSVIRNAPLFYASPTLITYQMPAGVAAGVATIYVMVNTNTVATGTTVVEPVTPGFFSANSDGKGVPAAVVLRVKADGTQTTEPVLQLNSTTKLYEPVPISIGSSTDQLFLVAYGTGFRNRSAQPSATIGETNAEVTFAGAHATLLGVDQANIRIPASLAGRGEVNVVMTVDGKASNTVVINIR